MRVEIIDDDHNEIRAEVQGRTVRSWSYSSYSERGLKMLAAREFAEGWFQYRKLLISGPAVNFYKQAGPDRIGYSGSVDHGIHLSFDADQAARLRNLASAAGCEEAAFCARIIQEGIGMIRAVLEDADTVRAKLFELNNTEN